MSDNYTGNPGAGGDTFAADDIAGVKTPRVKLQWGVDGSVVDASLTAPLPIQVIPSSGSGAATYRTISGATTNATSVKASAGTLFGIYAHNVNAAARYLKLYDKASAPTVGTDTPIATLPIPGATTGAGFLLALPGGIAFATGIALALTTGVADADTGAVGASEIVVNMFYK